MLMNLSQLKSKYGLRITGVIHAGAHHGQEVNEYLRMGIRRIVLVEPCNEAYSILEGKYRSHRNIQLVKTALGAAGGTAQMHIEKVNKGQSNSILEPAGHLTQYPDIVFHGEEEVKVSTLDSLNVTDCNFLNMDVQGYELEVLKGGSETLKKINYIYTEVNREEVYKGCAMVEELDSYLKDFDRILTDWGGTTWGDALYVRKKKVIVTPAEFRPHIKIPYPPDNDLIFEEWVSKNYLGTEPTERYYLPIHWTSYYVNNSYGKNQPAIDKLQQYLDTLDKSIKYFTVCQYDDGILNNVSELDLKVFCMSGHGEPLPLICKPHRWVFNSKKKYFANFIGNPTHPIRDEIFKIDHPDYYISSKKHSLEEYCRVISESLFTLCPRGYGINSFRIQEAVQYGSVPVYISDDFVVPEGFSEYGLLIQDISTLMEVLTSESIRTFYNRTRDNEGTFKKYFSYESIKEHIIKNA